MWLKSDTVFFMKFFFLIVRFSLSFICLVDESNDLSSYMYFQEIIQKKTKSREIEFQ